MPLIYVTSISRNINLCGLTALFKSIRMEAFKKIMCLKTVKFKSNSDTMSVTLLEISNGA